MKIIITTSTFPATLGDGVPRFVFDLAVALSKSATVEVLAPDAPAADPAPEWRGVGIHRFMYFWPRGLQRLAPGIRSNIGTSWLGKLQVLPFLVASFLSLRHRLRLIEPDVVNAHWLVPQGLIAALLKTHRRAFVLVLHVHAGDVDLLSTMPFGKQLADFIMARSDVVFTAGRDVTERLDHLILGDSGAITRPMGVDLEVFARTDRPEACIEEFPEGFILFVGRLVEKKGLGVLLEALPLILAESPGIGLAIVGDGPLGPSLRSKAEALGVTGHVRFLGPLSHDQIADHLSSCKVAVIPSLVDQRGETEGTPTVLIEAMAAGAVIVASEVAGIPELIRDAENGWLCHPNDPHDLARAIRIALWAEERSDVGNRARAEATAYSWERVASDYLAAIGQARQNASRISQ